MGKKRKTGIEPTRLENFPMWYQEAIKVSDLAEHSPVRGCMVIKPWGYTLWENMKNILDQKFKETGHQNAYFPLFIPLSYLQKEAKHIEGFAKECAIVTHHRLVKDQEGNLTPASPLEEPLIVRPTSEMMIGEMFSKWIQSYRDLPLLINQWANVVRWEMRTRLFLRTTEFLWQEGHTAHATKEDALEETMKILKVYVDFAQNILAIPVIQGEKTETERFPGAVNTYTFEMMMQDGKALQGGTSHFLGQNFSKAMNIAFRDQEGNHSFAWTTSWGVTTRLIGGVVMTHGDDDGIILPPRIASAHVVIIPFIHSIESKKNILSYCYRLKEKLKILSYHGKKVEVIIDERELRGGEKIWFWIKKGIPIRIEVGQRELKEKTLSVGKRTRKVKEIEWQQEEEFCQTLCHQLDEVQNHLFEKAQAFQNEHLVEINSLSDFDDFFKTKKGFASVHWCGDPSIEKQMSEKLNVSIRCIPLDGDQKEGSCLFTGKKSPRRVIFAKSY